MELLAILRSPHAALVLLGVAAVVGLGLSLQHHNDFGTVGCTVLLWFVILCVGVRFLLKVPEVDRMQPSFLVSHQDNRFQAQILNMGGGTQEVIDLVRNAVQNRKELPAPVARLNGPASDPSSIQEIDPIEAEDLERQDVLLLPPATQVSANENVVRELGQGKSDA